MFESFLLESVKLLRNKLLSKDTTIVVLLDNAKYHLCSNIKTALQASNAVALTFPSYQPVLNLAEIHINFIKRGIETQLK